MCYNIVTKNSVSRTLREKKMSEEKVMKHSAKGYFLLWFIAGGISFLAQGFFVIVFHMGHNPHLQSFNWTPVLIAMTWISVLIGLIASAVVGLSDVS